MPLGRSDILSDSLISPVNIALINKLCLLCSTPNIIGITKWLPKLFVRKVEFIGKYGGHYYQILGFSRLKNRLKPSFCKDDQTKVDISLKRLTGAGSMQADKKCGTMDPDA
jgi:hypothetical protein